MEELRVLQPKRKKRSERAGRLVRWTMTGGIVFWGTSLLTSLLPIAAQYRAAFSNWSVYTVWIGSFVMGMLNGFLVSSCLLRLIERFPGQKFVRWSVLLSVGVLTIALVLVDLPMYLQGNGANLQYFFVGVAMNAVRYLLLGLAIGCAAKRDSFARRREENGDGNDLRLTGRG